MNRKLYLMMIVVFAIMTTANADVLTVDNNFNSPSQYTTIIDAVAAANDGDIILVAGSPTMYNGATVNNKTVHIIGVGYNPDKQVPYPTKISAMSFSAIPDFSSSGSSIEGCIVNGVYIGSPSSPVSNITLKRNQIGTLNLGSNAQSVSNIFVINNLITGGVSNNYNYNYQISNVVFSNNIIDGNFNIYKASNYNNGFGPIGPFIIRNNIFIGKSGNVGALNNATFSNNIFYGLSPYSATQTYCSFSNNLSYNSSDDNFNASDTNGGGNNLVAQDPKFVNVSGFDFATTDDYNLQEGSPAINVGSDGKNIGIYGGNYPWSEGGSTGSGFMYGQEPQIPQVNQMNIINVAIPVDGTLNVKIKGIVNQ